MPRTRNPTILNTETAADVNRAQLRCLGIETLRFTISGNLTVAAGVFSFTPGYAAELVSAKAILGTAPATNPVIVDVNKNGITVYTTQSARPTVAAAATVSTGGTPAVTALAANDLVSVDIDAIGAVTVGANAVIEVRIRPARPSNR